MDHRVKWGLLIASLPALALLIAAALVENVFPQWRAIRKQYAGILERKASDARGRAIAGQFELRIQQNVLPELKTVDRCMAARSSPVIARVATAPAGRDCGPGRLRRRVCARSG